MELEAKIADLSFSAKRYFLCIFVLNIFHFEKSYGDFIFYACELRCAEKESRFFSEIFEVELDGHTKISQQC